MIDAQFRGKAVSSIPQDVFGCGFTRTDSYPALVLASPAIVPDAPDGRWRLAYEQVSGHCCNIFSAPVRELTIRPEIHHALCLIAADDFTDEDMAYFNWMPPEDREPVRSDYLRRVTQLGLTCSAASLGLLTQTLYPVDATPDNLQILTGENVDLHDLPGDGLVLFITGPWI